MFSLGDITTESVSSNSFYAFQLQVEREAVQQDPRSRNIVDEDVKRPQ